MCSITSVEEYLPYLAGPEDFVAANSMLIFENQPDGSSTPQCIDVQIINDNLYEVVEMFEVELQSSDVSPDPLVSRAVIVIMNDDSKS